MRAAGNCGNGDRPAVHEQGRGELRAVEWHEIAWHNGKNASATGAKAVRERREHNRPPT